MTTDYITEQKRKDLELELIDFKGPKRKKILENLQYAKSLGDLSENAEYHQTREDQAKLEERIAKIEKILQSSLVVSGKGSRGDVVGIGSTVIVKKVSTPKGVGVPTKGVGKEMTYVIVGSEEANMAEGKISNRSPAGVALFTKKKGDIVSFNTPNGAVNYKIVKVV